MAQRLSPGVFNEEVPSSTQVIQGVSASALGIVGYAVRGPANQATVVTSYAQFVRIFGDLTKKSFLPMSLAAFFSNGGQTAYVVRVPPADAKASNCQIQSKTYDQVLETGNGVLTSFTKTATTSLLKDHGGTTPIVHGSLSVRWRAAGTPVVAELAKHRDGTTNLLFVSGTAKYEGRIATASLPAYDSGLDVAVRGTVQLELAVALGVPATPILVAFPGASRVETVTVGVGADTTTATFDHQTGIFSILCAGTNIPAPGDVGALKGPKVSYTPATATKTATESGAGTWAGDVSAPGSIDYVTGAYTLTVASAIPHDKSPLLATYKINAWDLNPISVGEWGNGLKVLIQGNADHYSVATDSYSKFNVYVLLLNSSTGNYEVVETYEEVDLASSASAQYFPDVLNDLSNLVSVTSVATSEAPGELSGITRTQVVAGGDESAGGQTLAVTLANAPITARTVVITWKDSAGTTRTITDDGVGHLIGHVDGTGTNTVTYASGVLDVKLGYVIKAGTVVTVAYTQAAVETSHTELFGDTTKTYTESPKVYYQAGTEGTFDSTNWGINQFTATTLVSASKGLYALNKIDSIMQVAIPDFAGDVTVTGHLLDYAATRETMPQGGDRFIILTVPKGSDPSEAINWYRYTLGRQSKWAAIYWPWIKVADPLSNNRPLTMPPLGHIAGVYARTDNTRGIGKAPGGTVDGALNFLLGLEYVSTQAERDLVYPNKINPLISSPQTGLAVWGVRTISPTSEWKYVSTRRLFMYAERSVFESTHWIVFEPNGPALWSRIKGQLTGFLKNLYNDGQLAGSSASQAFFVTVDETNNPPESVATGQVVIDVGMAPNTPAEFIRFRWQVVQNQ